jgi:Uma2 family endonuclease
MEAPPPVELRYRIDGPPRVELRYRIDGPRPDWELSEEPAPESRPHDLAADMLKLLLLAWAARTGRRLQVGRNLALRWDEAHPKIGVDPDVYVIEPTPEGDALSSLRTWEEGHHPPLLAIEVVSASNSTKDYTAAPEKYAASGTAELWIFDPLLAGPKALGGPFRIQVWRREGDAFSRTYAGACPAYSPATGAWLFAVSEGTVLRIASDEAGTDWWRTGEEAERAAREAERAAMEAERAAKEEALRRIAELEARLAGRG